MTKVRKRVRAGRSESLEQETPQPAEAVDGGEPKAGPSSGEELSSEAPELGSVGAASEDDEEQLGDAGSTVAAAGVTSRRGFLAAIGGVGAVWCVGAMYPVYKFLAPKPAAELFDEEGKAVVEKVSVADVAQPGMGKNGGYGGRGLIIFRSSDGGLRAFDSKCTHAGCNVAYKGKELYCACHGGVYDLNGKVLSGPPPAPLTELRAYERDGVLYVSALGEGGRS